MEYLFEFLVELAIEGGLEASKCSKIPKPIRYLVLGLITLFFLAIIGIIYLCSFNILEESILGFFLFFFLATFLLIVLIVKFRKEYFNKIKQINSYNEIIK